MMMTTMTKMIHKIRFNKSQVPKEELFRRNSLHLKNHLQLIDKQLVQLIKENNNMYKSKHNIKSKHKYNHKHNKHDYKINEILL